MFSSHECAVTIHAYMCYCLNKGNSKVASEEEECEWLVATSQSEHAESDTSLRQLIDVTLFRSRL